MNDDCDIFAEITATATTCHPIRIQYIHVNSHQDQHKDQQLRIEEAHNVDCDSTAKTYVQTCNLQSTTMGHPEFDVAQPHLLIDSKVICWCMIPALWQAAAAPAYWEYLQKCYTWSQANLNRIQWSAHASALNSFQQNDQWWLILFIHDKLPLCTSKFHPHIGSQLCPSCKQLLEDKWHFLQCTQPEWCQLFEKLRTQLLSLSLKHALHPGILTTYWLGLLSIHNDMPYPNVLQDLPPQLRTAAHHQECLGWHQLFHDHLTWHWAYAIDQLNPHLAPSGKQIITQLTQVDIHHSHMDTMQPTPSPGCQQSQPSELPASRMYPVQMKGSNTPSGLRSSVPMTPSGDAGATTNSPQLMDSTGSCQYDTAVQGSVNMGMTQHPWHLLIFYPSVCKWPTPTIRDSITLH